MHVARVETGTQPCTGVDSSIVMVTTTMHLSKVTMTLDIMY